MTILRNLLVLWVLLISPFSASAQVARTECENGSVIELEVTFEGWSKTFLTYRVSKPTLFSVALVEVWDGHTLLFRKRVPVRKEGETIWTLKSDAPDTPSELRISLADLKVGSRTDYALIGGITDRGDSGVELVPGQSFVLPEGTGSLALSIRGNVLSQQTSFLLGEQESPITNTWIAREYLTGILTDLHHTSVAIPDNYLSHSTLLNLETMPPGLVGIGTQLTPPDSRSATIKVVSPDQLDMDTEETRVPTSTGADQGSAIVSVSPYPVPLMESDDPPSMELKVYGDNFRQDQQVLVSNGEIDVTLKTEFISPQEIHVQLPRELWQHHRLSEKFIAQTRTGSCSAQVWEIE